jgi:hypothetical protein
VFWKVAILFTSSSGHTDNCRWDTPQHVLVDDVDGSDRPEIWPGILAVLIQPSVRPLTVVSRQGL